jgi:bleomycin hydrolase
VPKEYTFDVKINLEHTEVKSQDQTGTCWCFAGASFIESELIRQGKGRHNLSEMFVVGNIYFDKALNYLLRKGKAQFGEGALAHDFLNAAERYGLVPDDVYSGLTDGDERHNHGEMAAVLEGMLKALVERRRLSDDWADAYRAVVDAYLGAAPAEFTYEGQTFTPRSFAEHLGFRADDYVSYTSYTHHPFGRPFVLEIPDNFSNGLFHNVPVNRLIRMMDEALQNGYTVAWDGDVSERYFSQNRGVAVLPEDPGRGDALSVPGPEQSVTQEMRQETFLNYSTTDDHLMHVVGLAHDQHGTKYYVIKNSWGQAGPHEGYLYMSEAFARLKTVAIILHREAVAEPAASDPASTSTGDTASR